MSIYFYWMIGEIILVILFKAVAAYFEKNKNSGLKQVRIMLFDQSTIDAFLKIWKTEFE